MLSPTLAAEIESECNGKWEQVTAPEGACGGAEAPIDASAPHAACLRLLHKMCTEVGNDRFNVYNMCKRCAP